MQDDWALAFFGIGDEHVHRAVLHEHVAPAAYFRIEDCRPAWRRNVRDSINCHNSLLIKAPDSFSAAKRHNTDEREMPDKNSVFDESSIWNFTSACQPTTA
jgi:hypothetical protein